MNPLKYLCNLKVNSETIPQAQAQAPRGIVYHIPNSANGHIILNFFKKGPVGWGNPPLHQIDHKY